MTSQYKEYGYATANPNCSHAYLFKSLLKMLEPINNKKILDVGCGNGFIACELLRLGYDVYGIDASLEGINLANQQFPGRFYIMDLSQTDLPYQLKDKKFDTIISTEVIEHLYDPRSYIKFCKSILKGNGKGELIISTPYHGYLKNLIFGIINAWDRHLTALWDGGHIKFWSRKTLSTLLEEQGFAVNKFIGSGRIPYLWKAMLIKATI